MQPRESLGPLWCHLEPETGHFRVPYEVPAGLRSLVRRALQRIRRRPYLSFARSPELPGAGTSFQDRTSLLTSPQYESWACRWLAPRSGRSFPLRSDRRRLRPTLRCYAHSSPSRSASSIVLNERNWPSLSWPSSTENRPSTSACIASRRLSPHFEMRTSTTR